MMWHDHVGYEDEYKDTHPIHTIRSILCCSFLHVTYGCGRIHHPIGGCSCVRSILESALQRCEVWDVPISFAKELGCTKFCHVCE
jgi:hypothetical protein